MADFDQKKFNKQFEEQQAKQKHKMIRKMESKLKDMNEAIERTYKCILNFDMIGIFGDYDVDGATSTALLAKYFLSINQKIKTYIPERKTEGYGPTNKSFKNFLPDKPQ